MRKPWYKTEWFGSLVFASFVLLVWIVAAEAAGNEFVLPSLSTVAQSCVSVVQTGDFWTAMGNTLLHTVLGFACAYGVGFGLAVLTAAKPALRVFFAPLVSTVRLIPTMAIVLVVCLWASDAVAPALVAFTVVMPTVYASTTTAFDGVDGEVLEMARFYGVSKKKMVAKIWIPLTFPSLVDGLAATLSLTLKLTVAAEVLVGAYQSLGGLLYFAKNTYLDSGMLFAVTAITVLSGALLQGGVRLIFSIRMAKKGGKRV